ILVASGEKFGAFADPNSPCVSCVSPEPSGLTVKILLPFGFWSVENAIFPFAPGYVALALPVIDSARRTATAAATPSARYFFMAALPFSPERRTPHFVRSPRRCERT